MDFLDFLLWNAVEKAELRRLQHSGEKRWANNLLQSKRFDGDTADCPTGSKTGEKIAFEQTPKARALGNRGSPRWISGERAGFSGKRETCISNLELFHVERYQDWCLFVDFRWASAVTIGANRIVNACRCVRGMLHLFNCSTRNVMEFSDENLSRVEYERQRVEALDAVAFLATSVREFERKEICRVIELCQGNRGEAAMRLGITRETVWRKLRRKS